MAWPRCEDCNGTGLIESESVIIGRSRYNKKRKGLVYNVYGKGDWKKTQCPCVGEEEWLEKEYVENRK